MFKINQPSVMIMLTVLLSTTHRKRTPVINQPYQQNHCASDSKKWQWIRAKKQKFNEKEPKNQEKPMIGHNKLKRGDARRNENAPRQQLLLPHHQVILLVVSS